MNEPSYHATKPGVQVRELCGRNPLLLDDLSVVWVLQEGAAYVFALRVLDGKPAGARQYLCTARAGDALPGVKPHASGMMLQAVGQPGCVAAAKPAADFFSETETALGAEEPAARLIACFAEALVDTLPNKGTSLVEATDETAFALGPANIFPVMGKPSRARFDRFIELFFNALEMEARLAKADDYHRIRTKADASAVSQEAGLERLREAMDESALPPRAEQPGALARAFAIVAAAHGHNAPMAAAPENATVEELAEAWGMRYRQVKLAGDWWRRDSGPLLGFLRDEAMRPVALLQPRSGVYVAHNPETGAALRIRRANAARLAAEAYALYIRFPPQPLGFMDLLRIGGYGTRRDWAYLFLCGLALAVLAVIPPVAMKLIFTDIIPGADRALLFKVVAMLAATAFSVFALSLVRAMALLRMTVKIDTRLEPAIWDRLISLPAAFHRQENPGEWTSRAEGIRVMRIRIFDSLLTTLLSGIFATTNAIMLFVFAPFLALPGLGLLLFGALAGLFFNVRQVKSWRAYYTLQGRITGMLAQFFSGLVKIRLCEAEGPVFGKWAAQFAEQQKRMAQSGVEQNRLLVFNMVFPVLSMMMLFHLATRGAGPMLGTGYFLAFLTAYLALQTALLAITSATAQLAAVFPIYHRMRPLLDALPENCGMKTDPGELKGGIELSRLYFRYNPQGPDILSDINLQIKPGAFVAIVGPSGSGKTTLLRLLLGFEQPASGTIRYDDKDLADLDLVKLRRKHLGVVLQNAGLLSGDILSNITGLRNLTEDHAWEALRMAGLEEDVRTMPLGLHAPIGTGGQALSGGQRQRLAIARALAGKPSILLLDEATSALDNRTQDIVTRSLDALRITRVVVAHRLSTVKNADHIVLLDAGRIVETGAYDELMARQGLFYRLVKRQLLEQGA